MNTELHRLVAEDFEPLTGTTLRADTAEREIDLVLEEVVRSPYPTARSSPGFSLLLRGGHQDAFGQGILRLRHPSHGVLELFVTPIGRDVRGIRYEIIFN